MATDRPQRNDAGVPRPYTPAPTTYFLLGSHGEVLASAHVGYAEIAQVLEHSHNEDHCVVRRYFLEVGKAEETFTFDRSGRPFRCPGCGGGGLAGGGPIRKDYNPGAVQADYEPHGEVRNTPGCRCGGECPSHVVDDEELYQYGPFDVTEERQGPGEYADQGTSTVPSPGCPEDCPCVKCNEARIVCWEKERGNCGTEEVSNGDDGC